MSVEETKLLTNYIGIWGWQILGIIFLCFSFLFFALERNLTTQVFYLSTFILFTCCEIMSFKRKREIYQENEV